MSTKPDRVLLIDDSATLRAAVDKLLTGAGYSVAMAASPDEARAQVKLATPDAVVLDLELNAATRGDELCPWLATLAPVIILSAHTGRAKLVMSRYKALSKSPEDLARLPEVVRAAIASRRRPV